MPRVQVSVFKQLLYLFLGVFLVGLQIYLCVIICRSLSAVALTFCFQPLPWPLPLPRMLWFHILGGAEPEAAVVVLSKEWAGSECQDHSLTLAPVAACMVLTVL